MNGSVTITLTEANILFFDDIFLYWIDQEEY